MESLRNCFNIRQHEYRPMGLLQVAAKYKPGLSTPVWMHSSIVNPFGVTALFSLSYMSKVRQFAIWLLCWQRFGYSSSAGYITIAKLWNGTRKTILNSWCRNRMWRGLILPHFIYPERRLYNQYKACDLPVE